MNSKKILLLFFVLLFSNMAAQNTAIINLPLTVSDNAGNSQELRFGLDPSATDGIDTQLGEATLPPFPPSGVFEVRFIELPNNPTESTWKDYRYAIGNYVGEQVHEIQYQLGTGTTNITIGWNLTDGVTGRLQDLAGAFIDVPMADIGSYSSALLLAFSKLKITLTYDGSLPVPVELTLFSSKVEDYKVILKWNTATEINNYGFEVERKLSGSETWNKISFVRGNGNSNSPKDYEYIDKNAIGGSKFDYRLKQLDNDGKYKYSNTVEVKLIPVVYELWQNYPNPFNMSTTIKYALPKESNVVLIVYDILGKEIKSFSYNSQTEGYYNVAWEGTDNFGQQVSSGIYICRIKASLVDDGKLFTKTIKLVMMK